MLKPEAAELASAIAAMRFWIISSVMVGSLAAISRRIAIMPGDLLLRRLLAGRLLAGQEDLAVHAR